MRRILENVEDEQSEIIGRFKKSIKSISDASKRKQLSDRFEKLNAKFAQGYDTENDNLMYGSLDDMEDMVKQLEATLNEAHEPLALLKELFEINLTEAKKIPLKKAARSVYHRDYLKTKNKPYRKYDPQEHAKEGE